MSPGYREAERNTSGKIASSSFLTATMSLYTSVDGAGA